MPTETLVLIPVVALALALGALFLPPRWRASGALLGASIATIATTTMFATNGQPTPELEITERPIEEPIGGYVGSAACRSCHPEEHDTWHDSYHRTMTQVASRKTVLGDFADVEFDVKGKHYKLSQEGDDYWVELDDPFAAEGGEALRVRRRISMTTGSHNMQAYWFESEIGRVLGQLPLSWQVEEKRWITRDASFVLPPDEQHTLQLSSWNFVCVKCHATQGPAEDGGDRQPVQQCGYPRRRVGSFPARVAMVPVRSMSPPTRIHCVATPSAFLTSRMRPSSTRPTWIPSARRRCVASAMRCGNTS